MKRFLHIDFLRALAILAVIVIHVFSDNITNRLTFYIWNYLHFVIVAFVFCSGYVIYAIYSPKLTSVAHIFGWYKKRLIRLLIPFYWYLLAHYVLLFFFPKFFSGLGLTFSWRYILQSIFLIGGSNLSWLPLLFLQLAIIFPLLVLLVDRHKSLFWSYVGAAFLITLGITVWQFPYSQYRIVMWIPWSLIFLLSWYFYKNEKSSFPGRYLLFAFLGAASFGVLLVIWQHLGRSLTLIDNKYPPNLFYLSYGIAGSFLVLTLSLLPFFQKHWVRAYTFVSATSYSLFFIHYIVLDFTLSFNKSLGGHINVWIQTCFVVGVSLGITYLFSKNPLTLRGIFFHKRQ